MSETQPAETGAEVPAWTWADASLRDIATAVQANWTKPYFGAVPYITAMSELDTVDDRYGAETGREIVTYFLSNASTWRGETARMIKAGLRSKLAAQKGG